jgi:hypothetical protein
MGWFVELLVYALARPLLAAMLALFGYDIDWNRKDGRSQKGRRLAIAALFCCALTATVAVSLIWLLWRFAH